MLYISRKKPKQLSLVLITFLVAIFNFITLAFTIVNANITVLGTTVTSKVTGYSLLKEYPPVIEEIAGRLSLFSLLHLIFAFLIVITLIIAFAKNELYNNTFIRSAIVTNIISVIISFIYLVNGSSAVSVVKDSLQGLGKTRTYSFIPFIITSILVVVFFIIKFGVSEIIISPQKNTYSIDKFSEIKKYKEMLDQGILTQEEFDAKKKQLLGL